MQEVARKRPSDTKGAFVKSLSVSTTMGPGVRVGFKEGE
jgi:large subunit ribosomal protein L1